MAETIVPQRVHCRPILQDLHQALGKNMLYGATIHLELREDDRRPEVACLQHEQVERLLMGAGKATTQDHCHHRRVPLWLGGHSTGVGQEQEALPKAEDLRPLLHTGGGALAERARSVSGTPSATGVLVDATGVLVDATGVLGVLVVLTSSSLAATATAASSRTLSRAALCIEGAPAGAV